MAKSTENWKEALVDGKVTDMHILEPTAMYLSADLCVVDDDPRLPKTKISGTHLGSILQNELLKTDYINI